VPAEQLAVERSDRRCADGNAQLAREADCGLTKVLEVFAVLGDGGRVYGIEVVVDAFAAARALTSLCQCWPVEVGVKDAPVAVLPPDHGAPVAILEELLPSYVRNAVYRALVDTIAGFYSAQRTAMKNATDNAGDMLNLLRRTYNRARQAQITQEIAEIVGGSAALEG
jgi:hypothetical protein